MDSRMELYTTNVKRDKVKLLRYFKAIKKRECSKSHGKHSYGYEEKHKQRRHKQKTSKTSKVIFFLPDLDTNSAMWPVAATPQRTTIKLLY